MFPNYLSSPAAIALLDACADDSEKKPTLDSADVAGDAQAYALRTISLKAASAVQTWAETDDLAEGEGSSDRLIALLVGIADENKDGELSDDEQTIVQTAANEAWSYLSSKGVADSDLEALFNAEDPDAANGAGDRVIEFLADALPDGDEAAADEMDDFAFGGGAQDSVFDAVYKKRFAVRNGKKMVVRRRVAGTVRLTAKQKIGIRKMLLKSHGSKATMKRMKSLRVRKSIGLK